MDAFINFLLNFLITYSIFKFALTLYQIRTSRNEQLEEEFEEIKSGLVTIEKVHQSGKDFWLVYSHEEFPKFLAQGYTEQEAIDNLAKLHPEKSFYQIQERSTYSYN